MVRRALIMTVALGVGACGGGSSMPSRPTPTVPSPVTTVMLMISPSIDLLKIQGSATFTVSATMSDTSTKTVTGAWTSDAHGVATVDSAGRVTGIASGQAVISVEYDGLKAIRTIRVVPDYQGNWAGGYAILTCQDTGDFAKEEWCKAALRNGVIRVTMALTQARDALSGSWTHDVMTGTVQGTIEADGTLTLAGTGTLDSTPMSITGWKSRSTDNESQYGTFDLNFASTIWSGSARATVEIRTCTKGS